LGAHWHSDGFGIGIRQEQTNTPVWNVGQVSANASCRPKRSASHQYSVYLHRLLEDGSYVVKCYISFMSIYSA
jgi:hypothetical protein